MSSHYRRKPLVVEARQVTYHNRFEVAEWCGGTAAEAAPSGLIYDAGLLSIETREGTMWANDGDFVVREPNPTGDRRFYPVKGEIFVAGYEEAKEPEPLMECPRCNGTGTDEKAKARNHALATELFTRPELRESEVCRLCGGSGGLFEDVLLAWGMLSATMEKRYPYTMDDEPSEYMGTIETFNETRKSYAESWRNKGWNEALAVLRPWEA